MNKKLKIEEGNYSPDVEIEINREKEEQMKELNDEITEINSQIGYAVENGSLDVDEAQAMSITKRKEWLKKNWKDYDPF